jgi:hypothetical protein
VDHQALRAAQSPVEAFRDVLGTVAQPRLEARYARTPEVAPMPFHMGYHWRQRQDAWMLCEKAGRDGRPATPGR